MPGQASEQQEQMNTDKCSTFPTGQRSSRVCFMMEWQLLDREKEQTLSSAAPTSTRGMKGIELSGSSSTAWGRASKKEGQPVPAAGGCRLP